MTTSPSTTDSDFAFDPKWGIESPSTTMFDFNYTGGREQLLRLYDKGTRRQWIGSDRLDWSTDVDLTNPVGMPDEIMPIFGTPWWDDMSEERRGELRRHVEAWRFSQFMHGEQGALICTAKIVQTVPDIDSKFYAATQVIDEARHVEVYSRYLHEKVQLVYPLNRYLKALLDDVISDSRWDMTYLGMQVLVEGLALAAFGVIRNNAQNPLAKALNAYVMQDEARHVMFGRLALRDYYPQLSEAERSEREDFCIEACYLMRDRFLGEEVWERLELPPEIGVYVENSETLREFRNFLFMRIVPILRDIGLWGPKLRQAFTEMGVIGWADADIDAEMASDEKAAEDLDEQRDARMAHVAAVFSSPTAYMTSRMQFGRGAGARRVRRHPQQRAEPVGEGIERLRHAGRSAPRHVRAPGAARLLPAAERGRALRAGGLLHRGLLPDAGPLPGRGGVGAPRAPARDRRLRREQRDAAGIPELLVHAHRAHSA